MSGSIPPSSPQRHVDPVVVTHTVGLLVAFEAVAMLASAVVPVLYGETYTAVALVSAGVVTGVVGGGTFLATRRTDEPDTRHAFVIAAFGWLVTILFGALPYAFAAQLVPVDVAASYVPAGAEYATSLYNFRNPLHALFESTSGWTTTGLTMAIHEPSLPRGLLWWRAATQWVGGMGVVLLAVTVLGRTHGVSSYLLYQGEAREEKLRPSVVETAKALWTLYAGLTLVLAVYFLVGLLALRDGVSLGTVAWRAVMFAMTTVSTGGFSVLDASVGSYADPAVRALFMPAMVAGAVSYPLYYAVLREGDVRALLDSPQARVFVALLVAGSTTLVALLAGGEPLAATVLPAVFQYVSGLSTTGYATASVADWPIAAVVFLSAGAMVVGGMAGATVGGVKILRAYLVARALLWELSRPFLPEDAIVTLNLGDETLTRDEMTMEFADATAVVLLYAVTLVTGVVLLTAVVASRFTLADVVFEAVSAQSTVGMSAGVVRPGMSPVAEMVLMAQMWLGRLEIVPVLVLVQASVYQVISG